MEYDEAIAPPGRQLRALLRKNATERVRRPVATACELCSSLLIMVVLVLGYNLSKIIYVDEAIYSTLSLDFPGRLKNVLALTETKRLENVTVAGSGDAAGKGSYGVDDAEDVTHFFKKLMEGPFPVPDFEEFVSLGATLSANLDFGSYEYLLTNNEAGRDFGNLLTLGTLHFAPEAHPAVPALINWFNDTYPDAFARVPRRTHVSEEAAVDYVLKSLQERAWAVISVEKAQRGDVSYTLRMNFTTVPDTHYAVDEIAIGLDSRFKRYYLSGYLTLQRCIDRFMFEFTTGGSSSARRRSSSRESYQRRLSSASAASAAAAYAGSSSARRGGSGRRNHQRRMLTAAAAAVYAAGASDIRDLGTESGRSREGYLNYTAGAAECASGAGGGDCTHRAGAASAFASNRALAARRRESSSSSSGGATAGLESGVCVPPRVLPLPMPTPAYHQNLFYVAVGFLLGLALTMSTMFPVSRLVKGVVEEKETRMTETLITMGLRPWVHAFSWWLTGAIIFGWIAISTTTLVSATFLPTSDPGLLLLFFSLFGLSEVNFALLLSTFFSKATLSAIVAPVALFAAVLPRYVFYSTTMYEAARLKYWCSLLSPTAFAFGADAIASYEYVGIGAHWGNVADGDYSLASSLCMMLLDSVLYAFLALYLGQVWPREFGSPKHPLFFVPGLPRLLRRGFNGRQIWNGFRSSHRWSPLQNDEADTAIHGAVRNPLASLATISHSIELEPRSMRGATNLSAISEGSEAAEAGELSGLPAGSAGEAIGGGNAEVVVCAAALAAAAAVPEDFEAAPKGMAGRVRLLGLKKRYPGKLAVAGVDLTLYEGQISCLLGHNGAGKTTVVSMVTGLTPPTSGDVSVWGRSVREELHKVRQNMGVCPQQHVLFPMLTVREHLALMADIKGVDSYAKPRIVVEKAAEVGLADKLDALSEALSGGMKRKLQVAMAFMGSPCFVLLDEPTSGMDPHSRRALWELLRRSRSGRVILLTTHYLDEADILGDRVAIMSRGKLRCAGSTLFLKQRFGLGYNLTLVRAAGTVSENSFDVGSLRRLIASVVPSAELLTAAGGEMAFRLPLRESLNFPELFRRIEQQRVDLGVGAYGVSVTSLEEVFLSLENAAAAAAAASEAAGGNEVEEEGGGDSGVASAAALAARAADLRGAGRSNGYGALSREDSEGESGVNGSSSSSNGIGSSVIYSGAAEASSSSGKAASADNGDIELREFRLPPAKPAQNGHDASEPFELPAGAGETTAKAAVAAAGLPPAKAERTNRAAAVAGETKTRLSASSQAAAAATRVPFWVQVRVLLEKRRIVAVRDVKGAFFQLALPALVILLVLAALSIELDISGPAMRMDPSMYDGKETEVLFDGPAAATVPYPALQDHGVHWTDASYGPSARGYGQDSTGLSRRLLDTIFSQGRKPRYAAFSFGDTLQLNVSVDWPWVSQHSKELVNLLADADSRSGGSGVIKVGGAELDVDAVLSQALKEDGSVIKVVLATPLGDLAAMAGLPGAANASEPAIQLLGVDDAAALAMLERAGLNETTASAVVSALDGLTAGDMGADAWHAFLNQTGIETDPLGVIDGGSRSGLDVRFDRAKLNATAMTIVIENVEVIQNNVSHSIGNIVLPLETAVQALPRGTRHYNNLPLQVPPKEAYTLLHNSTSIHALPAWVGELTRLQYRVCTGQDDASYVHYNHPLPLTAQQSLEVQTVLSLFASLFIMVPLCYAPAAFVVFLVKERHCKSKHVQLASGASPAAFWVSTYLFDSTLFLLLSLLIASCFWAFRESSARVFWYDADAAAATFLLVLMYGLSCLPLCYLYTFCFENHSTAQISIVGINFVTGFGFVLGYFILISIDRTRALGEALVHVFRLFPPYLMGDGLINVSASFYERHVALMDVSLLSWSVSGRSLAYNAIQALSYFLLAILVEIAGLSPAGGPLDAAKRRLAAWRSGGGGGWRAAAAAALESAEDVDVERERRDVARAAMARAGVGYEGKEQGGDNGVAAAAAAGDDYLVLVRDVVKVYPPPLATSLEQRCRGRRPAAKVAVRGVSLGIRKGERFGLLGENGAGKTTLLSVLTCDIAPTSGEVLIGGRRPEAGGLGRLVGYCPQVDPLLELMTASETLRFYGALKGMPRGAQLERSVTDTLRRVGLSDHANRAAGTFSGGNKRKLSLAVALIGDPPVLLLDEPSTGMDPGARRSMWSTIARVAQDRSVVITTHSLEEAEALCSRVGIMAAGRLRCVGSSQHLKARFGGGYSLELRAEEASMGEVKALVSSISPAAQLEEQHATLARYSLPAGAVTLSKVFAAVEARRDLIYDYGISQATLESVFLSFSHEQHAREEARRASSRISRGGSSLEAESAALL